MVSRAVPPTDNDDGENVFETAGRELATESVSELVQIPDVQETDGLELTTPAGGAIEAMLETWVCALTPRDAVAERQRAKPYTAR